MPAERTTMRQVREILSLKFAGDVPLREIARRVGVAASTVRATVKHFEVTGQIAAASGLHKVAGLIAIVVNDGDERLPDLARQALTGC